MKTKFTIIAILFCVFSYSQNKSNGLIDASILPASTVITGSNIEAFRFRPGIITQLDSGSDFSFETDKQWLSFGKLTTPNQTLYGFRTQRAGRGLVFGYTGASQTSAPTLGTPIIEWVGNGTQTAGDLLFRTAPSATSTVSTQVMKMRQNASVVFGNTSVFEDGDYNNYIPRFDIFSGTNALSLIPKVEINFNNNLPSTGLSVFRKGSYPTQNSSTLFTPRIYAALFLNQNLNTDVNQINLIYGISGQSTNYGGDATGIQGIGKIISTSNGNRQAIGVEGRASGGPLNSGVLAQATIEGQETGANSFGIRSFSTTLSSNTSTATNSYGVWSQSLGNGKANSLSYSIYGTGGGTNYFAGYFNGRIFSTNVLVVSDKKLKIDVKKEANISEKVNRLKPVTYKFINDSKKTGLNLSNRLQHGFIAQELEEVFPELVEDILNPIFNEKNEQIGTEQLKAVNYVGLISILTSSINEMSKKIEVLEEQLKTNKETVVVNASRKFSDSELLNIKNNSFSLEQNVPNPFTTSTQIKYSLPENEKNAMLLILNLNGQILKEFQLNELSGTIEFQNDTLSKGMYLYSLVANGEEIITKKMLVK